MLANWRLLVLWTVLCSPPVLVPLDRRAFFFPEVAGDQQVFIGLSRGARPEDAAMAGYPIRVLVFPSVKRM